MARRWRRQYPEAIDHVMNRGDRRTAIFLDDDDRRRFTQTLVGSWKYVSNLLSHAPSDAKQTAD